MAALPTGLENVKGIVLKRSPLGETDQIVSLYTYELGKIRVVASGSLRIRSRWTGKFEPFNQINAGITHSIKSSLYRFSHADVGGRPKVLMQNLSALNAAYIILECLENYCELNSPNPKLYLAALKTLAAMNRQPEYSGYFARCFCLRFFSLSGYEMNVSHCSLCNRERPKHRSAYCFPSIGGVVCSQCASDDQKKPEWMAPSAVLDLVLSASAGKPEQPENSNDPVISRFNKITGRLLHEMFSFYMDAIPKTLKLLESII